MKSNYKLFVLSLGLLFAVVLKAQKMQVVFDKYSENKEFRYVSISKGMVNLASFFGKEDAGNDQILSRVDGMKVLTLKALRKSELARSFFSDVENSISVDPPFEPLMEARENGVYTRILTRISRNQHTDIVILSKSDSTQHYIWLNGKISIQELQNMIKK